MKIFMDLCIFWLLIVVGYFSDSLFEKIPDETNKQLFIAINMQACISTLISFYITRLSSNEYGLQILYAFAVLSTQKRFKKRVERLVNLI